MTRARLLALMIGAALIGSLSTMAARPVEAQRPSSGATTSPGVHVEVVGVEGFCVIVATRGGSGTSDDLVAFPCQP